jgi:uncharacterized membrane protein YjgN (DUF898 family)
MLLNLVTLYIYSFWGKTNVRRHIWSCITVMDEPLEYTGTGKELALGFLIVFGAVIVPIFTVQVTIQLLLIDSHYIYMYLANFAIFPVVLFLVGVGTYRARRYRLSRTLWRGIRGTLTGSSWAYGARSFAMILLLPVTLFWTYPWMNIRLASRITREMAFGDRVFRFSGGSGPLYGRFAILWFGTLLGSIAMLALIAVVAWVSGTVDGTGGIGAASGTDAAASDTTQSIFALYPFLVLFAGGIVFLILRSLYAAGELNYIARCTGFEAVHFTMNATAGSLLGLFITNLMIQIGTLGIATPFVQQRLIRYVCDRLTVRGDLDVDAIRQSQSGLDRTGEGLAEIFDIDAF